MKQPKKKARKKRDSLDTLYNKRDRALERVVAIWIRDSDKETVDLNRALDVLIAAAVLRGAKNVRKERLSGQSQPRSRSRAGKTRRTCIRSHDADGSDRRNRSPPF